MEATAQAFFEWLASRENGPSPELRDWLDEWLELCGRRGLRSSTIASYRTMRLHVDDRFGRTPLSDITASQINRLYGRLLREGRRDGAGGLSARTVRYFHTVLNKALADAVRAGHATRNPAAMADPPSPKAARAPVFPVWSPEELTQYLLATKSDRHYLAFHVAATTGLRRGDLLGLRWCDVDAQPASGGLDARTTELIVAARAAAEGRRGGFDERGVVFTTIEGKPIHPAVFSYYFQRSVHRAGVRRIRLHDLRHTHATQALQVGIHPKVVSERLGHSTITITLDIYMHVLPSMQRDAAEAVAALIHV